MEPPSGLLDDIAKHLSKLPGKRTFTISCLVSLPRKSPASIFPYAPNTHDEEVHIQDVVLLIAEQSSKTEPPPTGAAYVSGLEAVLYIFPKTHSVIVYISKVDSTGQGIRPSPTKTLVLAFLEHVSTSWFVSRSKPEDDTKGPDLKYWNVWVQLFARAQNQYLFPASIEFTGKRVLSDIGLVKWWKGVLEEYISNVAPITKEPEERRHFSKFIVVPGLTIIEASYTLRIPMDNPNGTEWIVGHPYSGPNIIYPLGVHPPYSISQLIPYFPDDPKARLLDEIANTTTRANATVSLISSPPTKRRKLDNGEQPIKSTEEEDGSTNAEVVDTKLDFLRTVSADEFWARMDGRQECRLGTVAFFATYLGAQSTSALISESSTKTSLTRPKRAEVTVAMVRKVTTTLDNHDFGTTEKAIHSTEHLQNTIRSIAASYISITSKVPGLEEEDEENTTREGEETEKEDLVSKYIIREISTDNPDLPPKTESTAETATPVTVLTVRKKKKPPK